MTGMLPEGLEPDDEIEVVWHRKGKKTIVKARLHGVEIVVKTTQKSATLVPWVVASLPQILAQTWDAIEEANNDAQEAP